MTAQFSTGFYGGRMLALREIRRFIKVYHQTLISPVISALIFLSIFTLAINDHSASINGIKFINFMGYGLIIMTMVQNAFSNSSSSLAMSKIIGYVNDILMPPFSSAEIIFAYCTGAIVRGLSVGVALAICLTPFVEFQVYSIIHLIIFSLGSVLLLGLIGMIAGIYADSFDQMAAITNYIVTPLSFLSGTFYSVHKLPSYLQLINNVNPFFYMIDGFRYSLTGVADSNINLGVMMLLLTNLLLIIFVAHLLKTGWRLKN